MQTPGEEGKKEGRREREREEWEVVVGGMRENGREGKGKLKTGKKGKQRNDEKLKKKKYEKAAGLALRHVIKLNCLVSEQRRNGGRRSGGGRNRK